MVADVPPLPDPEHEEFFRALELNALARWWRARAGAVGETGARVIARDRPARAPEPPDAVGEPPDVFDAPPGTVGGPEGTFPA